MRSLLGRLVVLGRGEVSKDAELLALRHGNAVLRRQISDQQRPHRPRHGAPPLKPLPKPVSLAQYRIRRQAHADGLIDDYRLIA